MKQTALMMAIEKANKGIDAHKGNDDAVRTLTSFKLYLESLLPTEREQIEEAYTDGQNALLSSDWVMVKRATHKIMSASDYFDKTYKTDKP